MPRFPEEQFEGGEAEAVANAAKPDGKLGAVVDNGHICEQCQSMFKRRADLNKHRRKFHRDVW